MYWCRIGKGGNTFWVGVILVVLLFFILIGHGAHSFVIIHAVQTKYPILQTYVLLLNDPSSDFIIIHPSYIIFSIFPGYPKSKTRKCLQAIASSISFADEQHRSSPPPPQRQGESRLINSQLL